MNLPLIKLLSLNKGKGVFKAESNSDEATLYVYDYITSDDTFGGISALTFAKELAALTAPVINLRINSPGGDVFAARAMEQAIREHNSSIIAHIDGYAASAASYMALAANEVRIAPGGFFMIHKAWTFAIGNSDDLSKTVKLLNKLDESLVNTYVAKTGQSIEQITQWMKDETWFNANEAVTFGFADSITAETEKQTTSNNINWDLSAYLKAPKKDARQSDIENQKTQQQENDITDLSNHYRQLALIQKTAA